jgi:hypothetical protein
MPEAFSKQRLLLLRAIAATFAAGLAVGTIWFALRNRRPNGEDSRLEKIDGIPR